MAKWWESRAEERDDNTSPQPKGNGGGNWGKPANESGDTGAKSPDNSHKGDQE